jgi:RNA polymerase sigma-70 factor, ECF subfamily
VDVPGDVARHDEQALVAGLQAAAPWARSEFFAAAHDAVYAYACRLTRDVDLRRDWTHDCLLRLAGEVAEGRFAYRRPGSFWAWFRTRAPFVVLDSLRARRRQESRELAAEPEDGDFPDPPATDDPGLDLERLEILHAVNGCLDGLQNEDQRRVLALLLFEEMSYEEIAASVGRPLNTVRTDIRRGRLALRNCLVLRLGLE